jgi:phosphohistidine phosphatase
VKRLVLLRHAKSSWADDGIADAERPLSARGERDAPHIGARLHECGIHPDLVLASPAVRARSTARLVARPLDYAPDAIRLEPALYLAAPEEIMEVVLAQTDSVGCLLIVGHNPGLTDLTHLLVPDFELADLPTAGAVVIDCTAERWSEIRTASRRLVCYDFPRNTGPAVTAD